MLQKNQVCHIICDIPEHLHEQIYVLVMAIRGRCDIRAEEPDYSTESFRKAAYRQYILWRYKKLGRGNRRVCPSCVVLAIRQLYPAQDGICMGI